MAEPPCASRLQSMLQAAVQTIQWTYSLFWKLCPQQETLVWSDGYYNGPIKTRKTVQPIEVSTEEATLHRSQQLRELYESLTTGKTNRPSAALSPEDLTESEWFYLMCASFSFPPGIGLPGQTYVKQQHIWLTGANKADSKFFSRSILAESAKIQTVLCIPLLRGVVELATTERVKEDVGIMNLVKSFFISDGHNPNPPMPALSEHSTSTPTPRFQSPVTLPACGPNDPTLEFISLHVGVAGEDEDDESGSEYADTGGVETAANEPSELMQLDLSEDIRLGSPDNDGSNYLESDFQLLAVENPSSNNANGGNSHKAIQVPSIDPLATEEGSYYSQTVSTILEQQSSRWPSSNPSSAAATAALGAFSNWAPPLIQGGGGGGGGGGEGGGTSTAQSALKYILFTVPALHAKPCDPKPDYFSASHVIAERRRREKLKERFIMLRALVPFVTKMDKASILGDTIEYVKQLRKRIQELEGEKKLLSKWKKKKEKEKGVRVLEEGEAEAVAETKEEMAVEGEGEVEVEVSIIERDALVELKCKYREGVLLEVMQLLRGMKVEVTTVQSTLANGVFAAELRAKLKENVRDRKASIRWVKRSIHQVILSPFQE